MHYMYRSVLRTAVLHAENAKESLNAVRQFVFRVKMSMNEAFEPLVCPRTQFTSIHVDIVTSTVQHREPVYCTDTTTPMFVPYCPNHNPTFPAPPARPSPSRGNDIVVFAQDGLVWFGLVCG